MTPPSSTAILSQSPFMLVLVRDGRLVSVPEPGRTLPTISAATPIAKVKRQRPQDVPRIYRRYQVAKLAASSNQANPHIPSRWRAYGGGILVGPRSLRSMSQPTPNRGTRRIATTVQF